MLQYSEKTTDACFSKYRNRMLPLRGCFLADKLCEAYLYIVTVGSLLATTAPSGSARQEKAL